MSMTQKVINIGGNANDGSGDSLRSAFTKANENFSELYAGVAGYSGSGGNGYTGSSGSRGYTGSIGYAGSRGFTGVSGYTGSAGTYGYTGSASTVAGYSGSTGSRGYSGSASTVAGYTGSSGLGYTGSVGLGDIGYTGSASTVAGYTGSAGTVFVTPELYGAVGDGTTDDRTAIVDAFASGQTVIITKPHRIAGSNLTITSGTASFIGEGRLIPETGIQVAFTGNVRIGSNGAAPFDISQGGTFRTSTASDTRGPSLKISNYIPSNQSSTVQDEGFRQAIKDLFNLNYYNLDLEGRTITLTSTVDIGSVTGLVSSSNIWKKISNGQISLDSTFSTNSPTSTGTKSATLTKGSAVVTVGSTSNLSIGMEVTGTGIPLGTFILSIDSLTGFTLTNKVYSSGSVTISWKKHAFALDFSGFTTLSRFTFENIVFDLNNEGSGYFSSKNDDIVETHACRYQNPESYAYCQWAEGGGSIIINSDFVSGQYALDPLNRTRIGVLIGGDSRVMNNRWTYFKHAIVFRGGTTQFIGNHPFAGSVNDPVPHTAGIIYQQYGRHVFTGNYVDNGWVELRNDVYAYNDDANIGGFSAVDNLWTSTNQDDALESFIVLAPYAPSSVLKDVVIIGNIFRPLTSGGGAKMNYATQIDTTYGDVDKTLTVGCVMRDNTFDGRDASSNIVYTQANPAIIKITPTSGVSADVTFGDLLLFKINPKNVTNITVTGPKALGNVRAVGILNSNVQLVWDNEAVADTEIYVSATINTDDGILTSYTPTTSTTDTILSVSEAWGNNGTTYIKGGDIRIAGSSDSTGLSYIPSKLEAYLSSDGTTAPAKVLLINGDGTFEPQGTVYITQNANMKTQSYNVSAQNYQFVSWNGNSSSIPSLILGNQVSSANGNKIDAYKSRGGNTTLPTAPNSGDDILTIGGFIHDGASGWQNAASIKFEVDGTVGNGDTPGRITFSTATDGTSTLSDRLVIDNAGNILNVSTGGLGYGPGSGGSIPQTGSRTSGVTINTTNGSITLVSAAGSTSWQSITVTNSKVAATDVIIVNQKSGSDLYEIHVTAVNNGSFRITYRTTVGNTLEQPVFSFAVIKAVNA